MLKQVQLFVLSVLFVRLSDAAPILCQVHGGGILDNLVTQFGNAAMTWQTQINPIAKKIFFTLFGMEFMWQLMVKKVFAGDLEKLWVFFFTRTILCFFFAKYLVNIELYKGVITYISRLGSNLGGFSLNMDPSNNFPTLSPSAVLGSFTCVADSIHQLTDVTGAFQFITTKFSLALMQVILFVVLAFIAYCLMKVILQAYFLVYAGFLLTGFAGSSWTISFWQRYLQTVASVAIKFLVICLIMGILTVQMHQWGIAITEAQGIADLAAVVLRVLGSSIIIALIAYQLPEWAASSLSGVVSLDKPMSQMSSFMSGNGSSRVTGGQVVPNISMPGTTTNFGQYASSIVTAPLISAFQSRAVPNDSHGGNIFQAASKVAASDNSKHGGSANKSVPTGSHNGFAKIVAMSDRASATVSKFNTDLSSLSQAKVTKDN